ncbi:MAG TPA: RNA methyltransferase, partial [Thauera sp.]|nr:RNA methyltransferase [Thauera sp.]
LFAHVSPVDTPSGILALIDLPAPTGNLPFRADVLALDGIQDPGNLGTILRTAAAAGVHHVLLGEGCAQAWAPRVLRAGMGAHFLLQLEERVDLPNRLVDFPGSRIA